jgi:hypothetical protein
MCGIGAASVSVCCPFGGQRGTFGLQACQANRLAVPLLHEPRTNPALGFHA